MRDPPTKGQCVSDFTGDPHRSRWIEFLAGLRRLRPGRHTIRDPDADAFPHADLAPKPPPQTKT